VPTLEDLLEVQNLANEAGLPTTLISDVGYHQFKGLTTTTSLGIGPARKEQINHITGKYKLL